jgi:Flp pilus assembly protein TadD
MLRRWSSKRLRPKKKTRNEVLGARVNLYMAAKKWDMAAAVASHLVKVDPETAGWWISLAYAVRRTESVEKAEAILLRAQAIHPKVAIIAFNLCLLRQRQGPHGRGERAPAACHRS